MTLAWGCGSSYTAPTRNVIFISLDTTRADHMGFYGNREVKTPHLDRLAAESIVFDDFMSVVPSTLASHTSLFTGKYPQSHGTPRNGFVINERNEMLPEVLHEHGFATAGFVGSFALESRFGFNQGFDHYDETFERLAGRDAVNQSERSAAAVTDAVLAYLDQRPAGRAGRQFLFVHYFDPHAPYVPPPPYDKMYDPRGGEGLPLLLADERKCAPGGPDETERRMSLQYAGEISYLDEQVGRLLDGLRSRGILDEALLVLTSDHGEGFWEHPPCFSHGWNTDQTAVRAVGLVRLPRGRNAGLRVPGPVSTIDVLPSVLSYLRIKRPPDVEGLALDLEQPAPPADRARFAQATKPWERVETDPRWTNLNKTRCIRQGPYKLIQVPYARKEMLFDLGRDPGEQHDLFAENPEQAASIARELRPKLEAWAASARPLPSHFDVSQREETIRRLKSLGYVGGN